MSFDPPLSQIAEEVAEEVEVANADGFAGIAQQLFTLIVNETPVDKGIARGGWQPSVGTPKFKTSIEPNKKGPPPPLPVNPKLLPYILSNPLPYIETLEFGGYGTGPGATEKTDGTGFSQLAPHGMIRINMREMGLL